MVARNPFEIKGQSFSAQEYQNAISGKSLLEAEFNTNPRCNLDCGFCYTGSNSGDYI